MRGVIAFLLSALVGIVLLTIGNLVAQRILPTKTLDGFGRRIGYRIAVGIIVAGVAFGYAALYALFTGQRF